MWWIQLFNRCPGKYLHALMLTASLSACSSSDGPQYVGPTALQMGSLCNSAYECSTGFCCASPPCHGGMCTYACRNDLDCPYGTGCDGGACFWICVSDMDCSLSQTCKKGNTLCQY